MHAEHPILKGHIFSTHRFSLIFISRTTIRVPLPTLVPGRAGVMICGNIFFLPYCGIAVAKYWVMAIIWRYFAPPPGGMFWQGKDLPNFYSAWCEVQSVSRKVDIGRFYTVICLDIRKPQAPRAQWLDKDPTPQPAWLQWIGSPWSHHHQKGTPTEPSIPPASNDGNPGVLGMPKKKEVTHRRLELSHFQHIVLMQN
jgi:hypothetical protein